MNELQYMTATVRAAGGQPALPSAKKRATREQRERRRAWAAIALATGTLACVALMAYSMANNAEADKLIISSMETRIAAAQQRADAMQTVADIYKAQTEQTTAAAGHLLIDFKGEYECITNGNTVWVNAPEGALPEGTAAYLEGAGVYTVSSTPAENITANTYAVYAVEAAK